MGGQPKSLARQASTWSPSAGIFGPTTGLDPDLFDEHGRIRPDVRHCVMTRLDQCIRVDSGLAGSDWQQWTRVYLLGGAVSEWAGPRPNGTARDLDVIVAVNLPQARRHSSDLGEMPPGEAASALNAAFQRHFNADHWRPSFGGVWSLTGFCNQRAWDVTQIRPYAAYDLSTDHWIVRPPHLPGHSAADFDPAFLAQARAVAAEARAILRMPEPFRTREATALWDRIHAGRSLAFSPQGTGWEDPANLTEKWLAYAPRHVLDQIRGLALGARTAAAQGYLRNPYHGNPQFGGNPEWSHTWFHGTKGAPDFGTRRKFSDEGQRAEQPPGERVMNSGWTQPNQHLGIHFSPLHEVAHKFVGSVSSKPGALVHARLRFDNPAVFPSEEHLDIAMAHYGSQHYPHWHDDKLNSQMAWNYGDQEGTHRDFSHVPDNPRERWHLRQKAQSLLTWHPHMPEILAGFRQHLASRGHHGIVYGNSLEGPYETDATRGGDASMKYIRKRENWPAGHPYSFSAIAHPDDIEVTHVEHVAPWREEPQEGQRTWEDISDSDEPDEVRDKVLDYHRQHGGELPGKTASAEYSYYAGTAQVRHLSPGHETSPERVGDWARRGTWPPVKVTWGGGSTLPVVNGHHRYDAALRLGREHTPVHVRSAFGQPPMLSDVREITREEYERGLQTMDDFGLQPMDEDYEEPDEKPPPGRRQAAAEGPSKTKEQVNYREGTSARHCGNCVMIRLMPPDFETHKCTLVRGVIDPQDVCDEWSPDKGKTAAAPSGGQQRPKRTPGNAMVYLDVPHGTVEPYAGQEGGHHIALAYLPRAIGDEDFGKVVDRAREAATRYPPLRGTLGGHLTFPPGAPSNKRRVAVVPAVIPGVHRLQGEFGEFDRAHYEQYTPHVTRAQLTGNDPDPDPHPQVPVSFTHVHVRRGDEVHSFPLTGLSPAQRATQAEERIRHPERYKAHQRADMEARFEQERRDREDEFREHEDATLKPWARGEGDWTRQAAAGRWYHGSPYRIGDGELVRPGQDPVNADDGPLPHVFFTSAPHDAAGWAQEGSRYLNEENSPGWTTYPHVYEVEPTGPHEEDPQGEFEGDRRSAHPLRVVRERHDLGLVHEMRCPGCQEAKGTARHEAAAEHETWYHLTDNPHFSLDPGHEPEDNSFSIEDRSGRKGIYLGKDPSHWFSGAGEGYARPYLAEIHAHPSVKEAPGVHGRWGGEMFVPAEHFDKLRLHRVIPVDAHARETYGTHGWIEQHHGSEFDTGREIKQPGFNAPLSAHYPFKERVHEPVTWRYPGPDVRDMTPEQHDAHRDRWLDYLRYDRGFEQEDLDSFREQHDSHRKTAAAGEEEPQHYYHVSYERFPRGHTLRAEDAVGRNFDDSSGEHVYMTDDDDNAERYRYHLWEKGYAEQHKYLVRPTGPVEPDPNDDKAVRTRHPVEVVDALDVDHDGNEEWDSDWFNHRTAATGYDLKPRSGMIYLDLPPGTVRPVPGGVDDHHVTVVYLGSGLGDEKFAEACRRVEAAAAQCPPMEGVLRGIGIFPPSTGGDGKVVAFVPAYIGGVGRLRRLLEDLSASEHKDWKPHVTLSYMTEGDDLPEPHPAVPLRFTHVHVKRGGDVVSFPLTGRLHER